MKNKAIAKITDEMMATNNPAIQAIEEHLTERCNSERVAEKILAPGKNLQGAFKAIEEVAKSRRVGNCGFVSEIEAFEIVDRYFEIADIEEEETSPKASVNVLDLL